MSAERPILQFGCALAGVVLVNVNPANRTHELGSAAETRMRALFLHTQGRYPTTNLSEESCAGRR
jgi:acyl-CoA synthetase (AMP-forming)/AMP-acid ligase II